VEPQHQNERVDAGRPNITPTHPDCPLLRSSTITLPTHVQFSDAGARNYHNRLEVAGVNGRRSRSRSIIIAYRR
jgi:hypothetical protein